MKMHSYFSSRNKNNHKEGYRDQRVQIYWKINFGIVKCRCHKALKD